MFEKKKRKTDRWISDSMKHSSLTPYNNWRKLLNYYSSPLDYHVSTMDMNCIKSKRDIVGINCFNELLLRSEFITLMGKELSPEFDRWELMFYSKRLNIYVYKNYSD